jgi:dsDNA-binding SOS-regulon protein
MKYQLALQFPANSIDAYDEMIALEDDLIEKLGSSAKVDGHDCGSGEMNIFIHADEPKKNFATIRPVVAKRKMIENLVAAYRERTGEEYTVVWPIGFTKQFRIS